MVKFILKITPVWLKKAFIDFIQILIGLMNKTQLKDTPRANPSPESIRNTKVLLNRKELIKKMPRQGVVAELGVNEGIFSQQILQLNDPERLFLIDIWDSKRFNQEKRRKVEEMFRTEILSDKVQIQIGFSTEIAQKFADHSFDWIYIDTDHSYQTTKNELEAWRLKMKDTGVIAGHDYKVGNWSKMIRYGVIEAVNEFCSKYKWELIYITLEHNKSPSFAISKIRD